METALAPPADWKPRFVTLWTGQAFSLFGSQLVQFALIWHLTERTGSATTLAVASLVGLLPQVFLSPLIGTLVDRWNRRLILIAADASLALATLVLAALFALGIVDVWHIHLLMFVRAVGGGFHQSAFGASVVLLVPKEHLARVQGPNQALHGGLNVLAAPLGAVLLAWLPMQASWPLTWPLPLWRLRRCLSSACPNRNATLPKTSRSQCGPICALGRAMCSAGRRSCSSWAW